MNATTLRPASLSTAAVSRCARASCQEDQPLGAGRLRRQDAGTSERELVCPDERKHLHSEATRGGIRASPAMSATTSTSGARFPASSPPTRFASLASRPLVRVSTAINLTAIPVGDRRNPRGDRQG